MADHLPSLLYTSPSDFNQSCCCDSLFSTTRAASLASADRYLAFPPARAMAASWSRARAPGHVLGLLFTCSGKWRRPPRLLSERAQLTTSLLPPTLPRALVRSSAVHENDVSRVLRSEDL